MYLILVFFILLLLSAFLSASETAYFNLQHDSKIPKRIKSLLKNPRRLLSTILTGNTFVNIAMATLGVFIIKDLSYQFQIPEFMVIIIEILLLSFVIIIFGEILPKKIAIRNSLSFAYKSNYFLRIITFFIYPFAWIFYEITNLISKFFLYRKEKLFDSEDELIKLAELGEEQGTLHEEESDMIQSIFEFKEKMVREVMTPRVDMVSIESNSSIDELMDLVSSKQYSKIPIFKTNIDDIKGILYAKDFLPYLIGSRPSSINLFDISRDAFFVPETKLIYELLNDFKIKKINIAIVVDEWGGTSGLITLEDIVEEVVGEIRDPYDNEESNIIALDEKTYLIDASITIYDLEEEINELDFPEDRDYDTLGGFILNVLNEIPKTNQKIELLGWIFIVKNLEGNRISKVKIKKI